MVTIYWILKMCQELLSVSHALCHLSSEQPYKIGAIITII